LSGTTVLLHCVVLVDSTWNMFDSTSIGTTFFTLCTLSAVMWHSYSGKVSLDSVLFIVVLTRFSPLCCKFISYSSRMCCSAVYKNSTYSSQLPCFHEEEGIACGIRAEDVVNAELLCHCHRGAGALIRRTKSGIPSAK
jgi:hypothetical protein